MPCFVIVLAPPLKRRGFSRAGWDLVHDSDFFLFGQLHSGCRESFCFIFPDSKMMMTYLGWTSHRVSALLHRVLWVHEAYLTTWSGSRNWRGEGEATLLPLQTNPLLAAPHLLLQPKPQQWRSHHRQWKVLPLPNSQTKQPIFPSEDPLLQTPQKWETECPPRTVFSTA